MPGFKPTNDAIACLAASIVLVILGGIRVTEKGQAGLPMSLGVTFLLIGLFGIVFSIVLRVTRKDSIEATIIAYAVLPAAATMSAFFAPDWHVYRGLCILGDVIFAGILMLRIRERARSSGSD